MITLVGGVALFLLFAAGIIAYQNSRMIADQETDASRVYTGNLMYSVYKQDFSPNLELPEAIPLFQFTVFDKEEEELPRQKTGTTRALCRVAAGRGEMVLSDAQTFMKNSIREAALRGSRLEHLSFPGKADRHGEKEMIKSLEAVAKEEAAHADQG